MVISIIISTSQAVQDHLRTYYRSSLDQELQSNASSGFLHAMPLPNYSQRYDFECASDLQKRTFGGVPWDPGLLLPAGQRSGTF